MHRISCERYPCHFPDQDCSLCFCPFYPCMDEKTNGRLDESGEWTCMDCFIVHCRDTSAAIIDALMTGETVSNVWKKVERFL
jgi:threonine-phosphate decarboxylase